MIQSKKPIKSTSVVKVDSLVETIRESENHCIDFIATIENISLKHFGALNYKVPNINSDILKVENKNLKKAISYLKNELKIMKHMKVSAMNLNKHIFKTKFPISSKIPISNELEMLQQKSQDVAFINCHSNVISLFGIFKSFV